MCGFVGIYRPGEAPIPHRQIRAMTQTLTHRGPDSEGCFIDGDIALGHRRLAVIDTSSAGHQPMTTSDGRYTIAFNGEIYNFRELRAELEALGERFQSTTDTEVVLLGFKVWGADIVERLNGMFAFALWDDRKRELTLVRDRYGIKPLYFWMHGREIVFASEIKAILAHPDYSISVNAEALNEYFTFQNFFRYHTFFKDIHILAPARIWKLDARGQMESRAYWDFNFTDRDENLSSSVAHAQTLHHFHRAVSRQSMADVEIGSYLSGGMDSGAIVAAASATLPRLKTFTCGFDMSSVTGVEANYDERRDAELMASTFKTEHYEQVINAGDLEWSMPRLIHHLEDFRLGMTYPNFYISRLASRFTKVCFSGAGGDELFGGYPWRYYRVFKSINRDDFFRQYYDFWQRLVPDQDKAKLFTGGLQKEFNDYKRSFETFRNVFLFNDSLKYETPEDHIANCLYFEAKTFLHGLFIAGDKLSMAHGLEERFPFMDNDLVNFSQRLPIRHKLGNLEEMKKLDEDVTGKRRRAYTEYNDGKNVLRNALSDFMPEAILNRKKQGFSAPDESWYRGENLAYVQKMLLNKRAASRDYLEPAYVRRILEEHVEQKQNHRLLIWSFLCFEWWCKIYLDGYKVS